MVDLRARGLDVTRPILAVLDGSKSLRRAMPDVFERPVIARCQLHKIRNVRDHLPQRLRGPVEARMRRAYHAESALNAQAQTEALARELDKTHPGAAAAASASTDTCTYPHRAKPSNARAPKLSNPSGRWDRDRSLMIDGPPPNFHEDRDILPLSCILGRVSIVERV